jgi:hypothetical protein
LKGSLNERRRIQESNEFIGHFSGTFGVDCELKKFIERKPISVERKIRLASKHGAFNALGDTVVKLHITEVANWSNNFNFENYASIHRMGF